MNSPSDRSNSGNAKYITFALPPDVTIVPNTDGLTGVIKLWREDVKAEPAAAPPSGEPGDRAEASI
jgi:hypothetical protein